MNTSLIWTSLLQQTLASSNVSAPRGERIREVFDGNAVVDMNQVLITLPERKLSLKFAFTEAWWMLTGRDDVETLHNVSKTIVAYSDDGVTFFGAYGKRYINQRERVLRAILRDNDTRHGVITFWDVANPPDTRDLPCSLSIQWLVRNNKLHAFYNMRSSDLWLGWPYDIFSFTCMTYHMLLSLRERDSFFNRVTLGDLHYHAGSMHLYDKNMQDALNCVYANMNSNQSSMVSNRFDFRALDLIIKSPNDFIAFLNDYRSMPNKQLRTLWE